CKQEPLCTKCPDLAGLFALFFQSDDSTGNCAAFGLTENQAAFSLQQNGATLLGTIFGVDIEGNVFASGRIFLAGSQFNQANQAPTNMNLCATTTAPGSGAVHLEGRVQGDFSFDAGNSTVQCTLDRVFVADR